MEKPKKQEKHKLWRLQHSYRFQIEEKTQTKATIHHHHHQNQQVHQSEAEPIADLLNKLELKKKKNNDDDQGKGLHVLLQDYSSPIDYHPSTDGTTEMPVTQIDSTSSDFTKTSIMDDNSVLDISGPTKSPTYLEILLSDNSKPKNSLLITDYGVNMQEYSSPVLDGPSLLKSRNMNKNEHIGDTVDVEEDNPPMELIEKGGEGEVEDHYDVENTIEISEVVVETDLVNQFAMEGDSIISEVIWEDKAVEAPHVGQIEEVDNRHTQLIEIVIEKGGSEYNPKMQLILKKYKKLTVLSEEEPQVTVLSEDEDEDEDDDEMDVNEDEDEEEIVEKGEESSDGTVDSSMEPMLSQFGRQSQYRNYHLNSKTYEASKGV
ncbi:unnamed protein product [Camellia sinensis]